MPVVLLLDAGAKYKLLVASQKKAQPPDGKSFKMQRTTKQHDKQRC